MDSIYLDNNATTPLDPGVLSVMMPYMQQHFGNAASRSHRFGMLAESAVDQAREHVAAVIGASEKEIVWTSGATESNNLAIKGVASAYGKRGRHIIIAVTEHRAVIDPCRALSRQGFDVTVLPVDEFGRIDLNHLEDAVTDETILVSIMAANNEIGTIQPIARIGEICRQRGTLFHTDATQAFGKIPLDVDAMKIDLLSASAHKIHGPKGTGLLYVRGRDPRVRLEPLFHGGGHERGIRSGTVNVPGVVGFAEAARIASLEMADEASRLGHLRDRLWNGLNDSLDRLRLNGDSSERLPNTLNIGFGGIDAEELMLRLENIAVATGSACSSAIAESSYVLKALGLDDDMLKGSIRFSLGRFNTADEIETVIRRTVQTVLALRAGHSVS